jgi:hypothetical protein
MVEIMANYMTSALTLVYFLLCRWQHKFDQYMELREVRHKRTARVWN